MNHQNIDNSTNNIVQMHVLTQKGSVVRRGHNHLQQPIHPLVLHGRFRNDVPQQPHDGVFVQIMHLEEKEQEEDIDQIKKYNVVQTKTKQKGAGSF